MYDKELMELMSRFNILEKAYDFIQLVDPVNKKVIKLYNNTSKTLIHHCYDCWEKNVVCNNCISYRAYWNNKTYVKMDYNQDNIFMVTAVPIDLPDRRVVVELFKNATDSLIIDNRDTNGNMEIHHMIDRMNSLALKDSLTGVYNRRYIDEKLPAILANAAISEQSLSVIIADIDNFKIVNDTYGHLAGDCTLKYFAGLLSQSLKRKTDWVSRYGGEEFLICLPGADNSQAAEIAELMRRNTENYLMECGEHKFKITSSFGVSTQKPHEKISPEDLIEAADKKLYEAKHNGRNRVEA
jgi:diguanylate cyclase (GGDEF)-like protein